MPESVLVTGAYGFIASHCILQLLAQGYQVRGTLRSLEAHEAAVRHIIAQAGLPNERLSLVQADLLDDAGWEPAMQGCRYVLHVASPVGAVRRSQADRLIRPAVEGTLRVLRAAAGAGVERLVLTSSMAAVIEGNERAGRMLDERDWSRLDGKPRLYSVSKTLAERAAWDFISRQAASAPLEMAAINPGVVLGTLLDPRHTSSTELILRMLRRSYPGCARVHWMLVDVGDVAEAHLRAMTSPQAAGERFCCISEILWMTEMARILNTHFKDRGLTISERTLPDGVMRLYTLFDAKARDALSSIGLEKRISNHKLISLLGRQPRRMEGSIIETAESLVRFGLV